MPAAKAARPDLVKKKSKESGVEEAAQLILDNAYLDKTLNKFKEFDDRSRFHIDGSRSDGNYITLVGTNINYSVTCFGPGYDQHDEVMRAVIRERRSSGIEILEVYQSFEDGFSAFSSRRSE